MWNPENDLYNIINYNLLLYSIEVYPIQTVCDPAEVTQELRYFNYKIRIFQNMFTRQQYFENYIHINMISRVMVTYSGKSRTL